MLSKARKSLAATSIGDYALFGGGANTTILVGNLYNTVDAYNTSLTQLVATTLSVKRGNLSATSVGDYALFGGGFGAGTNNFGLAITAPTDTVDAYNKSLTLSTITALSVARCDLAATTLGNYALFGGGSDKVSSTSDKVFYDYVDVYDKSLTHAVTQALSTARNALAATSVGDYALFGGGYNYATGSSTYFATVDAYSI